MHKKSNYLKSIRDGNIISEEDRFISFLEKIKREGEEVRMLQANMQGPALAFSAKWMPVLYPEHAPPAFSLV